MTHLYGKAARRLLVAPLLLFMGVVVVFPLGYGIFTSLREHTLFSLSRPFVGFAHYTEVLADTGFWRAAWFTGLFTVVTVCMEMVVGLALALLFNQRFPGKRLLMTVVLLPIMIASSLMAVLWRLGLNENIGLVPALFEAVGISLAPFSTQWATWTLFTVESLHWTPLVFLLCYAGLQSVPEELYEACKVDGAGYWRTHWHVVFPNLRGVVAVAVFLRTIDAAKSFDLIYVLTGGGPGTSTTNASIYIYKTAFVDGDFGLASAASVITLLLLLALVPLVVRQVVKR